MSSSDGTGGARRALAQEPQIAAAAAAGEDEDELADPWFAPGRKVAATEATQDWATDSDEQAEWFLPTGRAGLLPDSMTESWDDNDTAQADHSGRAEAVGAPPWGRDSASGGLEEPPPWETGPWPGPGGDTASRPAARTADPGAAELSPGDRGPGRESGQRSRLIIAGSAAVLILVVVIVVIVIATSGGPVVGCATYPAPVRAAYARAMSDLSGHASASVQAADLERAASLANASAASAGQITARTALFTMASDLDEASSDVARHRQITPDLQQRLTADGTALPRTCPG